MCHEDTPRPQSEEELWKEVSPERFQAYQSSGGKSASMIDHYYDKLLQIAFFDKELIQNDFLCSEASKRVQPLVNLCLEYGKTGVVPEEMIRSYM